jgi:hypothetical protein
MVWQVWWISSISGCSEIPEPFCGSVDVRIVIVVYAPTCCRRYKLDQQDADANGNVTRIFRGSEMRVAGPILLSQSLRYGAQRYTDSQALVVVRTLSQPILSVQRLGLPFNAWSMCSPSALLS